MPDFAAHTFLITGAAAGIGRATALRLQAQRARLVLVDRDAQRLAAFSPDQVRSHVGDVADEAFWDSNPLAGNELAVLNAGVASAGQLAESSLAES